MNKSFLKWVGSKYRILDKILPYIPCNRSKWFEPFIGSGTMVLNLPSNIKQVYMNDFNFDLINLFSTILNNKEKLITDLEHIFPNYSEDYYNSIKSEFNNLGFIGDDAYFRAVYFIYLNKYGFNGLCRYNKSGKFNVPSAKKEKPVSIPVDEINNFSNIISSFENVHMFNKSSEVFLNDNIGNIDSDSIVYCDPPYLPLEDKISTFTSYTGSSFWIDEHKILANQAKYLSDNGAFVLISNHNSDMIRDIYSDASEFVEIDAKRSISCKGNERGIAKELLIIYRGGTNDDRT